jgi:uncharacterized protein YbbC (DUF1343 family)
VGESFANLRNLTEAELYPGVALIEGTNVSVGGGRIRRSKWWARPDQGQELAAYLNGRGIQSVRFVPITFTPSSSNFAGERCEGVNLIILDRNTLDSPELGIELASALHKLYPNDFKMERMADLLVNQSVFEAIGAGEDPRRIAEDWQERLEDSCACGKSICCTSRATMRSTQVHHDRKSASIPRSVLPLRRTEL